MHRTSKLAPYSFVLRFGRGWAKGARLTFLQSQLERYKVASSNSRIKGREAVDAIVNDYFKIFDWRLPVTQEPEDGAPPPNPILEASLPPEEERVKQQVVARMKQVRDAALEFYAQLYHSPLVNLQLASLSDYTNRQRIIAPH